MPDDADKPGTPEKPDKAPKPEKAEKPAKQDKAEKPEGGKTEPVLADLNEVELMFRTMGQIANNANLYSINHKVTQHAVDTGYNQLLKILEKCESVGISVSEGNLLADGRTVSLANPLVVSLNKRLQALEAGGFALSRGITRDEFIGLMELITTPPEKVKEAGSFTEVLTRAGVQHIQARRVIYQAVTEEDIIVNRGELEQALGGTGAGEGKSSIEDILSFLSGKAVADVDKVATDLREMAPKIDNMADLIIKAGKVDEGEQKEGESFANAVVGSVKRLYETLLKSPAARTQQGKKEMIKTLQSLEKEIIDKLNAEDSPEAKEAAHELETAMEEMIEDLKIDGLAADYTKKVKMIETTEKRLLKFIKSRQGDEEFAEDLEDLQARLEEGGLDIERWEELLAKSARLAKKANVSAADAEKMAALLAQLTELVDPAQRAEGAEPPAAEMASVVTEINEQVSVAAGHIDQQLARMEQSLKEIRPLTRDATPEEIARQAMSRRQMIVILAEIVQELRQPLAVITCTIEMLGKGQLGPVTEPQKEMLDLSLESGHRLETLIENLARISGMPTYLQPDAQILGAFYEK